MIARPFAAAALGLAAWTALPQTPANKDSQVLADFTKRLDDYVKIQKTAHEGLEKLRPTKSSEAIEHHEHHLGYQIRELRKGTHQGDIFSPEIADEFRRLIGITMQGSDAARIRVSLRRAEPVHLNLQVNGSYPRHVPLQSTPPTLLLNLPRLASGLEYRVVGRALVLLDTEANLIVDFIPDAIPSGPEAAKRNAER